MFKKVEQILQLGTDRQRKSLNTQRQSSGDVL